jgi:hypothetical protein
VTTVSLPLLSRVHVASPCPVKWEDMQAVGDGSRVRHCDQCDYNVYNLSAMTARDAEALLEWHEGRRLCGAFYRREDGTILTQDCPVGLALVRARLARGVARVSAAAGLLLTGMVMLGAKARGEPARLKQMDPFAKLVAWLNPAAPLAPPLIGGNVTLGYMVCPSPAPPPPPLAPLAPSGSSTPATLDFGGGAQ